MSIYRCPTCGEYDGEHDEEPHMALARRDAAIDEDFDVALVLR